MAEVNPVPFNEIPQEWAMDTVIGPFMRKLMTGIYQNRERTGGDDDLINEIAIGEVYEQGISSTDPMATEEFDEFEDSGTIDLTERVEELERQFLYNAYIKNEYIDNILSFDDSERIQALENDYPTPSFNYFNSGYVLFDSIHTDGSADVSEYLEYFVKNNQGKMVKFIDGATYLINGFGTHGVWDASIAVYFDFGRSIILYDNDSQAINIDNTGNAGSEYTVSAISNVTLNSDSLVTRLTLSSASSVEAHQWIALYSDDANPSKSGGRMGQIHQVLQDETADPYVYLCGEVKKLASYTTAIKMRVLDSTNKVFITGGIFTANGDADDLAITTREEAIKIMGYVDPVVTNAEFVSPWAQCLWSQCNAGLVFDEYKVRDTLNNAGSNGYTYGLVLYGMNGNCVAKNGVVRNARHPAGTTDGNSGSTTTWYHKGEPTNGVFLNTVGYNCYGSVLDSHEEGINMIYDGLVSHNGLQDERGIFVGRAFQGRSFNETLRNVTVNGGAGGISFDDVDHGEEDTVIIENVCLRGIKDGGGGAYGVDLKDNAQTNLRHYRFNGLTIDDTDKGVNCGIKNIVTYKNYTATRCDEYMDVKDGAVVTGTGTTVDYRNSTAAGSSRVFRVRSAAASSPYIRLLDNPIVMKDTSNQPTDFFYESDTTTTKYVYHPGITEFNDGGVTSVLSKTAGHTTFTDLTDVTNITL